MTKSTFASRIVPGYFDKKEASILFYIVLAGFLFRLIFILEGQGNPFFDFLFSDSKIYDSWADRLAGGKGWFGSEAFFMAPAYPYFLGIIYTLLGKSLFLIRIFQALISSLTIVLIYLTGRNLFSGTAGYIAAVIASAYSVFIFYSGAILSETLQVFVASILIFYISFDPPSIYGKKWFLIGLFLGLSAILRGNILVFYLFVIIYFIYTWIKKTESPSPLIHKFLIFSLGVFLPILPVTLNNYIAENEFILLTTNGGINFFIGNNENSQGVFVTPDEFNFAEDMSGQKFAELKSGTQLSSSEASGYWYDKGIEYITGDFAGYVWLEIKKLTLFFGGAENPQSAIMDLDFTKENYSRLLQLPFIVEFTFISVLSLAGIFLFSGYRKKYPLIYLYLISYILSTILFFVNGRFRMALTPLLIVFAAIAIVRIYEIIRNRNFLELRLPALIIACHFLLYYFLIDRPVFNPYDAYLHLGDIASEQKKYEEAVENYKRSLFYRDYYITYMNLGNAYALNKNYRDAIPAFNLAINRKPDYLLAHFNLGFAYTQLGDFDRALKAYEQVLKLDPDYADAYRNIGIIYYINEQFENALPFFDTFLELSNDEMVKASVREDIKTIKKRMAIEKSN